MPATRTTGGTRSACSPPCGEETRGDASMNDKLDDYVDSVFAPYEGAKSISELKAALLADLHERFRELKAEGKDDAAAFELTIDSIGDIEQTVQEVSNLSRSLERQPTPTGPRNWATDLLRHRSVQLAIALWAGAVVAVFLIAHGSLPFSQPSLTGDPVGPLLLLHAGLLEQLGLIALTVVLTLKRRIT